jgi:hypothetical protein
MPNKIMGWSYGIGEDRREIGYSVDATCDHPGCKEEIHRGLSYACGDQHGSDVCCCEKYFCEDHRRHWVKWDDRTVRICDECASILRDDIADGESHWLWNEEQGQFEEKEYAI